MEILMNVLAALGAFYIVAIVFGVAMIVVQVAERKLADNRAPLPPN